MIYQHHQLSYEINNEWLVEAGALGFKASREFYRAKPIDKEVLIVSIESVEPLTERARIRGIFCDDEAEGVSAKERVVRILRWFVADDEVEPVEIVESDCEGYKYKLVAGCHRFHCAHAVGFKSVPATKGFDINAPYA